MQPLFPRFTPSPLQDPGSAGVLGAVEGLSGPYHDWVQDGHSGCLVLSQRTVFGHWSSVGAAWRFTPELAEDRSLVETHEQWYVLDGYYGERAEIVLDETRQWRVVQFEATDSIRSKDGHQWWKATTVLPRMGVLVRGGWTHEHCAICWATIDEECSEAFVDDDDTWVCPSCFRDYVATRSLGFAPHT